MVSYVVLAVTPNGRELPLALMPERDMDILEDEAVSWARDYPQDIVTLVEWER